LGGLDDIQKDLGVDGYRLFASPPLTHSREIDQSGECLESSIPDLGIEQVRPVLKVLGFHLLGEDAKHEDCRTPLPRGQIRQALSRIEEFRKDFAVGVLRHELIEVRPLHLEPRTRVCGQGLGVRADLQTDKDKQSYYRDTTNEFSNRTELHDVHLNFSVERNRIVDGPVSRISDNRDLALQQTYL
jgi:hypothetical protein